MGNVEAGEEENKDAEYVSEEQSDAEEDEECERVQKYNMWKSVRIEKHAGEYVSNMFSMDSQGEEGVGGGDLSHETLGIESHQEQEPRLKLGPKVGLNKNKEEKYESSMNVMEGHEY
jgi:hypothetical protein